MPEPLYDRAQAAGAATPIGTSKQETTATVSVTPEPERGAPPPSGRRRPMPVTSSVGPLP